MSNENRPPNTGQCRELFSSQAVRLRRRRGSRNPQRGADLLKILLIEPPAEQQENMLVGLSKLGIPADDRPVALLKGLIGHMRVGPADHNAERLAVRPVR